MAVILAPAHCPVGVDPTLTFQFPSDWMRGFCTTLNHRELVPHCVGEREAGATRFVDWVRMFGYLGANGLSAGL